MEGGQYLFVRGKFCVLKSRFIAMHKMEFGTNENKFRIYWDGGEALLNKEEARIVEDQLLGGAVAAPPPHPVPEQRPPPAYQPDYGIVRAMEYTGQQA